MAPMAPMATEPVAAQGRSNMLWLGAAALAVVVLVGGGIGLLLSQGGAGDEVRPSTEDESNDEAKTDDAGTGSAGVATTLLAPAEVAPTTTALVVVTPTTAPATTVAPSTVPATTEPPPVQPLVGDLGLAQLITQPVCDDTYITVLASAVDPDRYASAVADSLVNYQGSNYLKTVETCSSLRPSVDGADIYVVYFGPYVSRDEACDARVFGPTDAYVRTLSLTVPDTHRIQC